MAIISLFAKPKHPDNVSGEWADANPVLKMVERLDRRIDVWLADKTGKARVFDIEEVIFVAGYDLGGILNVLQAVLVKVSAIVAILERAYPVQRIHVPKDLLNKEEN